MTGAELEVIDEQDELLPAVREPAASPTLFGTTDPAEVVRAATAAAKPLAKAVRDQGLAIKIQGREYVKVEGWTLLGSMLGVFPITVWTHQLEDGWEARVEARTRAGEIIGAAEHQCLRSEKTWANRDDYALRSMAATRATAKALRMPLGFVMQLAGFEATPADEMPRQDSAGDPQTVSRPPSPPVQADASTSSQPSPAEKLATEGKKKKLNALVGQLRDGKHLTTTDLYTAVGVDPDPYRDEDGVPHWKDLRELLTDEQASELITRLSKYAAKIAEAAA